MAIVDRIERNYFGVTLYVTARTGRQYACKAVTWEDAPRGGLRVLTQTWPGYGRYQGWVMLNRAERQAFFKAFELKV